MAIETFEYIDDLNVANPTATDNVSEGDDHLRGLKTTLKNTFPNVTGAINATETELNYVDGVTSNIQTQLGTKLPLAGGTMTGTIAGFTSTGIDDNATSTAITIDASENVGIGVTAPDATLETSNNTTTYSAHFGSTLNATGDNVLAITAYDENPANTSYLIRCTTNTGVAGAGNDRFSVLADGRGLSPFTSRAWVNLNGAGTIAIRDSHNVSSITDNGTGDYTITFANAMPNTDFIATAGGGDSGGGGETTFQDRGTAKVVGSYRLYLKNGAGSATDRDQVYLSTFANT